MKELISVIVPIYNAEKYLNECIDSIINQSYKNLEIILIDDGSKDNSLKICNEYKNKDKRVKVIHKSNSGLSDTRNVGIKESTGEFIYLIDSDDYLYFNKVIEEMHSFMKDNVDIVMGYYVEKIDDNEISYLTENRCKYEVLNPLTALNYIYETKKYKYNFTVAHNKLYRKSLFDTIMYPVGKIHEDEFTTYKLFLKSRNIILLNQNTYIYRIRNNSIMRSNYNTSKLCIFDAYKERIKIFKDINQNYLVDKTNFLYFYNLLFHRYMLLKNGYIEEYKNINKDYKKFLKENIKYKFNKLRIKFFIKTFVFKKFRMKA